MFPLVAPVTLGFSLPSYFPLLASWGRKLACEGKAADGSRDLVPACLTCCVILGSHMPSLALCTSERSRPDGLRALLHNDITTALRAAMLLAWASAPAQQQTPSCLSSPESKGAATPLWPRSLPLGTGTGEDAGHQRLPGPHPSILPNLPPHQGPKSTGVET